MATVQQCRACQRTLLDTFVSFAGLSLASSRVQSQPLRRRVTQFGQSGSRPNPLSRTFHTSLIRRQEQQQPSIEHSEPNSHNEPDPILAEQSTTTTSSQPTKSDTDASIPWYLRVATPPPISPQSLPDPALQDIPQLPSNSPPILEPILTHLSITTGLDALTILDLRELNPPSALGSNLIMILGTARSEKHLNTSADRFCRWLRSTYKLRPYADGLLGRNELKLKMRRRNKKIKLAQSVGNTMFDQDKGYDDGITTGWICCNLGSVDAAQAAGQDTTKDTSDPSTMDTFAPQISVADKPTTTPTSLTQTPSGIYPTYSSKDQERPLEDEDEYSNPSDEEFTYRGFGSVSMAPKIVVQMFTEAKRAEMDLEGLWEARIRRRDSKEERQDRLFETSVIEEEIETPGVTRVDGEEEERRGMRGVDGDGDGGEDEDGQEEWRGMYNKR